MKVRLTHDKILKINEDPVAFVSQKHLGLSTAGKYEVSYALKDFRTKKILMEIDNLVEFRKAYKGMDWHSILDKHIIL